MVPSSLLAVLSFNRCKILRQCRTRSACSAYFLRSSLRFSALITVTGSDFTNWPWRPGNGIVRARAAPRRAEEEDDDDDEEADEEDDGAFIRLSAGRTHTFDKAATGVVPPAPPEREPDRAPYENDRAAPDENNALWSMFCRSGALYRTPEIFCPC